MGGGGNPVKKITKTVRKAVRQVKNEAKDVVKSTSKVVSKAAGQVKEEAKNVVEKVSDDVLNIDPPKPTGQSETPDDGAARTAEEETVGKDDKKKKRRKRTSKGKLKVPMVATQKTTGVKA
jgi:hypothetical protein